MYFIIKFARHAQYTCRDAICKMYFALLSFPGHIPVTEKFNVILYYFLVYFQMFLIMMLGSFGVKIRKPNCVGLKRFLHREVD